MPGYVPVDTTEGCEDGSEAKDDEDPLAQPKESDPKPSYLNRSLLSVSSIPQ
jgi:hypothetical protein